MSSTKRQIKKAKLQEAGITLVALVVTIIVLLILAGVTISLALNNNGVIERAQYASNTWANATKNETTMMTEINDQVGALSNVNGKEESEGASGGESGGESISKDTGALGAPMNYDKYGSEVTNYTANGMKWKLFYEDTNNVYLISETTSGGYPDSKNLQTEYTGKSQYSSGADVSDQGKALLPLLGGATSSSVGTISIGTNSSGTNLLTESNTNRNILGLAYLCDTSDDGPWSAYKAGKASWTMGAPTIELYAASYNATHQGKNQITLGIGTIGYTENTGSDWLKKADNQGIYNLTGSGYWCLAGPSNNYDGGNMWYVKESDGYLYYGSVDNALPVRPVVCFKKSNFQYELAS